MNSSDMNTFAHTRVLSTFVFNRSIANHRTPTFRVTLADKAARVIYVDVFDRGYATNSLLLLHNIARPGGKGACSQNTYIGGGRRRRRRNKQIRPRPRPRPRPREKDHCHRPRPKSRPRPRRRPSRRRRRLDAQRRRAPLCGHQLQQHNFVTNTMPRSITCIVL